MKVLLIDDIHKVGMAGDIKDVSAGFARNYLLPKKLALPATEGNLRKWESEKKVRQIRVEQTLDSAKAQAAQIEQLQLDMEARAGREGHLFGSITSQMIADALLKKGFEIDRKNILLDAPIKTVAVHNVAIRLHPQVTANVKVVVNGGVVIAKPEDEVAEETEAAEASEAPAEETPAS